MVVTYGDVPLLDPETLRALLAEHAAAGNAVTVLTARLADPTGYGRIVRDRRRPVDRRSSSRRTRPPSSWPSREINSGVYAFDAGVLRDALGRLSTDNAQGELYLTDAIGDRRAATGRARQPGAARPVAGRPGSTTACSWPRCAPS